MLGCLSLAVALAAPVDLTLVASVRDGLEHDAYDRALRRFEAMHPGVDVHLVSVRWQGWDAHDTLLRFGALEDPWVDVLLLDTPWVPEMARPGWLLPLDDHIDTAPFVPTSLAGGRYDGALYGVPLSLKGNALYYRRDLLEEEGLAPPTTLAELTEAASRLAPRVGLPIGLHHDYLHNDLLPMMTAAGGGFEADGRPILDHRANVEVMEQVQGWFIGEQPLTAPVWWQSTEGDYTAPERRFGEGDAAFLISWSTRWQLAQKEGSPVAGKVGVTRVPGLRAGEGAANLGSWYLSVARASRHPDLALELVAFLTSEETQRAWLDELGEIPSRSALLTDEAIAASHPQVAHFRDILPAVALRPRVPNEREVSTLIEAALHRVVRGADAEGTLEDLQRELQPRWLGPLPPEPDMPVWQAPPERTVPPAWGPLLLGLVASLGVVGALLWVLRVGEARQWAWLASLRPRLMLVGGTAVLCIAWLQSGVAASLMLRQQAAELASQHEVLREALEAQALASGKDLSLAASLLYDPDDPEPVRQLLLASHFTEALVGLQWVDRTGRVVHDADQGLFEGAAPTELPDDLAARVARGTLQVRAVAQPRPSLEVLAPIIGDGVHVGSLRALISQDRYLAAVAAVEARHRAARRDQLAITAGSTALVMVLGLLAIVVLSRRLTDPIRELTGHAARIRRGDLEVHIQTTGRDEVGQLAATMAGMVEGLRDRDFVRDTFGRYLTPALAEQLLSNPDALALGGTLQRVTILMSDLRGFTALSERLGPQGTVTVLNRYLGRMTEVIVEEGGTIDEFLGDAILVLFGAPVARPDDAERAVRCALRMQAAMEGFNEDSAALGLPALEMGIGLCTGDVVAGNIGSEQRAKYGVVGDPVNTAARVESLTVGGQVLVAGSTVEAVGTSLRAEGPFEVAMKGKEEELPVFEVRGLGELEAPGAGPARWEPVSLQANLVVLVGKRVEGDGEVVAVVARGGQRVQVAVSLPVFADVRLRVRGPEGPSGDVYGKVVGHEGAHSVVHITAGRPGDRTMLLG